MNWLKVQSFLRIFSEVAHPGFIFFFQYSIFRWCQGSSVLLLGLAADLVEEGLEEPSSQVALTKCLRELLEVKA
jgi:hypothetical protein